MLFSHWRSRKIRSQKGFSFVEVIISLFVLSIGFLGVVNLSTTTLRNSFLQRDAVVASMLVQEGAELVYNIRDTNLAKGATAFAGVSEGTYRIDFENPTLVSGSYQVSLDSNGFYGHSGTTPTKFSRKVIVAGTSSGGVESRKVTVVVVWGGTNFPTTIDTAHCGKSIVNPSGPTIHCAFSQTELQEN
ncbi:MAG: prepilin-type N-terminal cleavage/methylation domain-containing protein [Candidatus Moraniibacteriota bacterium]|nr:MAG: prepilin-type N-terminal cleavage/methylation domain-containing protein [Candidatus Moranbacteria bacterium]